MNSEILPFVARQPQHDRLQSNWLLAKSRQPQRIRQLAAAGLSIDAICILTGWGPRAVRETTGTHS